MDLTDPRKSERTWQLSLCAITQEFATNSSRDTEKGDQMNDKVMKVLTDAGAAFGPELAKQASPYVAGAAQAVGGAAVGVVAGAAHTVGAVALAAAPVVLPVAAVAGAAYGLKKLWDWLDD